MPSFSLSTSLTALIEETLDAFVPVMWIGLGSLQIFLEAKLLASQFSIAAL